MTLSDHFRYEDGELTCDGVSLREVARAHGTPTFVYSAASIRAAYRAVTEAVAFAPCFVAYAVKANDNLAVLSTLAKLGAGADIVSGGELSRALRAGFSADRIVYSGVGKRDDELEAALRAGVRAIHAESGPEIDAIEAISKRLGRPAAIALRINPDVDPKTHPYIATGLHGSKFGLELGVARTLLPRIVESPHLELETIAIHIGSMIGSPAPLADAVEIAARFIAECREAGAAVHTLDAGGGWPIDYGDEDDKVPSAADFGRAIRDGMERAGVPDLAVGVEPGRSLVGGAGALLSQVIFIKQQNEKRFAIVDAAMTELIRPALYRAYHHIAPVRAAAPDTEEHTYDVVGPVCESGDFLALGRTLPTLDRGDLIAILGAGAYAAVMASRYNARPRAAEVMVDEGKARIVRERERDEDLWRGEHA